MKKSTLSSGLSVKNLLLNLVRIVNVAVAWIAVIIKENTTISRYFSFLPYFIRLDAHQRILRKSSGKAGIIIKNTFLSNTDNASNSLRKGPITRAVIFILCLPDEIKQQVEKK
jgi:hypothetical protein